MTLQFRVDSLDDVDESLHKLYTEDPNGKGYVLDVEGESPEAADLKRKLKHFRETNITTNRQLEEMQKQMSKYEGVDPQDIKGFLELQDQIKEEEEKRLLKEGKIEELMKRKTAAMRTDFEKKLQQAEAARKKAIEEAQRHRNTIADYKVERAAMEEIDKAGVKIRPGAMPDVLRRARDTWKADEHGEIQPIDQEGSIRYGKDGGTLSMAEFIGEDLVTNAAHLFEGSDGGGASGGRKGGAPGQRQIDATDGDAFGANLEDIAAGKVGVRPPPGAE